MKNDHVSIPRRRVLSALGGVLAAGVSGCCSLPKQTITNGCVDAAWAPLSLDVFMDDKSALPLCFDAHAHFFNAADVPIAGYLKGPVGHTQSMLAQALLAAAAPVVEVLAKSVALSPAAEMANLCKVPAFGMRMNATTYRSTLDRSIDNYQEELAKELFRELNKTDFRPLYLEMKSQFNLELRQKLKGVALPLAEPAFSPEQVLNGLRYGSPGQGTEIFSKAALEVQAENPDGFLAFLGRMLSPRLHNLRSYMRAFSSGQTKTNVDACFGALVDFNYWLDCPDKASSIRDQILIHEQLSLITGGYLLSLAPYNPWTDIKNDGESLRTLRWAVEEHGFVGVKIYPPMGFYPYGNADPKMPYNSTKTRPNPSEIDERLKQLYKLCTELDIPVMAHSGESMGRDYGHDLLPGPSGWREVIELSEEGAFERPLRINVGHFGGDSQRASDHDTWPSQFVELMKREKNTRLYGDLGYWNDLRSTSGKGDIARRRLNGTLGQPIGGGQSSSSRVMYGSDWLMIAKEAAWYRYADDLYSEVNQLSRDQHDVQGVFWRNAAECFGVTKSGSASGLNRRRLEAQYLRRWGGNLPAWMQKLDQQFRETDQIATSA